MQDVDSRTAFGECQVSVERNVDDVVFTDNGGDVLVPSFRTRPRTPGTPAPENVTGVFADAHLAVARCVGPDRSTFYWVVRNDHSKPVRLSSELELQKHLKTIGSAQNLQFVGPREYVAGK
ncbi:MAG TPA: hypothetical protein VEB22_01330 [Phycisphaerales bacterium]|nr:hypothetical protein [Phycisphaerales bacterium]